MPEFKSAIDLRNLNGHNGFQLSGEAAGNRSGSAVASAGDVNGDGFDDVIVNTSYVVFGKAGSFAPNLQLSSLNGVNGFQISGDGGPVASAGDVNGDGFADVIIGGRASSDDGYAGASYVVFGKAGRFASNLQLSSLDGNNGFKVVGNFQGYIGRTVSSAGDVNGDGFADVIIGDANAYNNLEGDGYVVFGKAGGFAAEVHVSSLDGRNGFRIDGPGHKYTANRYAGAGDVNGDGFDDLIVGEPHTSDRGYYSGRAQVVFGHDGRFPATLPLSNLDGTNGFTISGEAEDEGVGLSVASARDVNGDGFGDVIVTANNDAAYVVFGKAQGFASNLEVSSLDGANGFKIDGVGGFSVASAGDVNGDGFAEVIIGDEDADPPGDGRGASYVVFGKAGSFPASLQVSSLNGSNGFRVNGEARLDFSGGSVASAGDVDRDGFADVIVGAPGADPNGSESGASYVVFGHRAFDAVNRVGTPLDNTINGGRGDDTIRGLDGDDRLIAWEGNDLMFGNGGRDRMNGRSGHDRLIGGIGPDVLIGGFGNDVFDFNQMADSGPSAETRDVIRDFTHLQDKIDLSDLGSLAFIGTAAFTAPGQVRVVQQGPNTIVEVNLSGDATPEMTIALLDVAAASLTMGDFIL
jgi:Ca2+-binding RTX toxin-like protein